MDRLAMANLARMDRTVRMVRTGKMGVLAEKCVTFFQSLWGTTKAILTVLLVIISLVIIASLLRYGIAEPSTQWWRS